MDRDYFDRILSDAEAGILTSDTLQLLTDKYKNYDIPPCRVCGSELTVGSMGGGRLTEFACSEATIGTDGWLEHYGQSKWTAPNKPDRLVTLLIDKYKELQENCSNA